MNGQNRNRKSIDDIINASDIAEALSNRSVKSPQFSMTQERGKNKFNLHIRDDSGRWQKAGKTDLVDTKSTKSGLRNVYKFTDSQGVKSFYVASGSFNNQEEKERLEKTISQKVSSYALGSDEYKSTADAHSESQSGRPGFVSIQPAAENRFTTKDNFSQMSGGKLEKEMSSSKYWSKSDQMNAYPVPTSDEKTGSLRSRIKDVLIGETVRDVYGQPQSSMSLLNLIKEAPRALDVTNYFGYGSPNLPGQETRSGFSWDNPGMVADARQRQELFTKLQDYRSRDDLETSPTTGKTMVDYLGQDYKESLVEDLPDESGPRGYAKDDDRRNMLSLLLFGLASPKMLEWSKNR